MWDFEGNQWSGGPNGTPSVVGDALVAMSSGGDLACVYLQGKVRWKKSMLKDFGGAVTLVARRGKVVHFDAHGLMDIGARKPMRSDALFRLASMIKLLS